VAKGMGTDLPKASPAAAQVQDVKPSPAVRIIGRMKETLQGRSVGVLIDDGSDAKVFASVKSAIEGAGARVVVVAPKVGGATLSDGKKQAADAQLAGCPSVLHDAVALVLEEAAAEKLCGEAAAVQFVMDAFGHLKAIGHTPGAQPLLDKAGIVPDDGVVPLSGKVFVAQAAKRFFDREPTVRSIP
jgi:catalase